MKPITVVALVVVAALVWSAQATEAPTRFADQEFLVKQRFVLEMFQHLYQDDVFVTKYDASFTEYRPWEHVGDYNVPESWDAFVELWQHKPLYDDEVFSVVYEEHKEYAVGLVELLHAAKDWPTFTHAVFWARTHCNKQLFLYAMTVVSLVRTDMAGIVLPAVYEVQPWHFFDTDAIELAEKYQMHGFHNANKLDGVYNVAIKANYSDVYGAMNADHRLAYFTEDVGLNAFYYHYHIDYPYWADLLAAERDLAKDRRGELYFFVHRQLLARYHLERLSHGLGAVAPFDVQTPLAAGYRSGLRYYNGMPFPERHNHYDFRHAGNLEHLREIEAVVQRVKDAIAHNTEDPAQAVDTLGNAVQGNENSVDKKFYGSLDRWYRLVADEGRPYGKHYAPLPGTFMHYETSVRDPLFYAIYTELVSHYWSLVDTFAEYTKEDFGFAGVKIDAVTMPDTLTTYFEAFDADISNAVNVEVPHYDSSTDELFKFGRNAHYKGASFMLRARQQRLNHKPFEFELKVVSDRQQAAVVKLFIGPKRDEHGHPVPLEHGYRHFVELEHFKVDLQAGVNTIKRSSLQFGHWVQDRTTYYELYRQVFRAITAPVEHKFPLSQQEAHCGAPNRLMLPKGATGTGLPYRFFFMVYPFHAPAVPQHTGYDAVVSCGVGSGARYVDAMPMGFPFNRPVHHAYHFDIDNFKFRDVHIVHKDSPLNVV